MTLRLLLPALLSFSALAAQQEPGTPPPAPKAENRAVAAYSLVTLAFPGGTLGELVSEIRTVLPAANIVVAPGATTARLPAIDLRGAGLDQALEAACAVAQSDHLIRVKDFRGTGQTVYTITAQAPAVMTASSKPGPTGAPMLVGSADVRRAATEVHSLNRLLDPKDGTGFAATTVLSAIEAAVGVDGELAALRFHKESGLLIFRGTAEQVATVRDVLSSLERDVQDRRKAAAPKPADAKPHEGGGAEKPKDR